MNTPENRIAHLEAAVRYLWNAWSEAEGEGQPRRWVFGPNTEDKRFLAEQGESWHEAPAEVQVVIRSLVRL